MKKVDIKYSYDWENFITSENLCIDEAVSILEMMLEKTNVERIEITVKEALK